MTLYLQLGWTYILRVIYQQEFSSNRNFLVISYIIRQNGEGPNFLPTSTYTIGNTNEVVVAVGLIA